MTVPLRRRLAVLLAGLALFPVIVLPCEPAPAETSTAELTGILDGRVSAATSGSASTATLIQLYRASCLKCHDSDGRGGVVRDVLPNVPDFTDAQWHASRSDAELSRSILHGKGKSMPRMKMKLGSVDVQQMVSFVRAFQAGNQVVDDEPDLPAAPDHSTGGTESTSVRQQPLERAPAAKTDQNNREVSRLFQRYCATCHGPDGKGTGSRELLPMIPDFTRREWHEGRSEPRLVVSVLDGKGARMPSFAGKLAREQARDMVAFIRSFAPTGARPAFTSRDEFEARLRELNLEFENLQRQIQALPRSTQQNPSDSR